MSDAYFNLIKAARMALESIEDPQHEIALREALEEAEAELEPWQREELNGEGQNNPANV